MKKRMRWFCGLMCLLMAMMLSACDHETNSGLPQTTTRIAHTESYTTKTTPSTVTNTVVFTTTTTQTNTTQTQNIPGYSMTTTCLTTATTSANTTTTRKKTTKTTTIPTTTRKTTSTQRTITTTTTTTTKPSQSSPSTADFYAEILRLVNEERVAAGKQPLQYYSRAQAAADTRAVEIGTTFSHTRPNGETCFTALDEINITYRAAGENIASGYASPEAVMNGWMNSEGHRANILSEKFTHLVVGINGKNWVQLFLTL